MGETSPVSTIEAIKKAMRDHIKVDATGLSPAVASAYVFGFDEAAKAIAEIIARQAEALQRENAELRRIGGGMANVLHHWKQQSSMRESDRRTMADLQKQWDAIPARALLGGSEHAE